MAYGLTGIKNLPKQTRLSDFSHYPSSLLLSSWTTNNENSVNLVYGFAMQISRNYEEDYYLKYVVDRGIIWFVPFVNIDSIEM